MSLKDKHYLLPTLLFIKYDTFRFIAANFLVPFLCAARQYKTLLGWKKTLSAPSVSMKSLAKKIVHSLLVAWRRCYRIAMDDAIS